MPEPRPWVPGIVYVTGAGDLRIGPSVGYRSLDPSFAGLRCGWGSRVSEWTHSAWVVVRADLNEELMTSHGVVLPESLVDRSVQPHAYRWLREQPLVAVSGASWAPLVAEGVRLFRVAFDATGDRLLRIDVMGHSGPASSVVVAHDGVSNVAADSTEGPSLFDVQGDPSLVDRLLRFVSDGIVGEDALLNAVDARRLVEDGYGYRGARDGWFRDIDDVAHHLGPLDALFGQIFARGDQMRSDAEALVAAIETCADDASELVVGRRVARPITVVAREHRGIERLVIDGDELADLVLPAERRWSLGDLENWSPKQATKLGAVPPARASVGP